MCQTNLSINIRNRIIAYSVAMFFVAIIGISYFSILPLYRQLRMSHEDKLLSLAVARSSITENFFRDIEDHCRQMAARTGLRLKFEDYSASRISRQDLSHYAHTSLSEAIVNISGVICITCLDADGNTITNVGKSSPFMHLLDDSFSGKMDHSNTMSPVQISGSFFLKNKISIRSDTGKIIGWLVVLNDLTALSERFERKIGALEEEETILVWEADGRKHILLKTGDSGISPNLASKSMIEGFDLATQDEEGIKSISDHSQSFLMSYANVSIPGLAICVIESEVKLLANVDQLVVRVSAIGLVITVVGLVGMVLLLRPLTGKLILRSQDLENQVNQRTSELQKEREQLTRLTRQLKDVNTELDAFTRTVAHDLRAPLATIKGYADLLLMEDRVKSDDEFAQTLGKIINGVKRSNGLITDLLDFARSGNFTPERSSVDLTEICNSLYRELMAQDPQRNVEVTIDDNLCVFADPLLIRIAMQNLLSNAWKYTSKTAQPQIFIRKVCMSEKSVIMIKDNGIGFDMMYAEHLFEPFKRLHSSQEYSGTGIGLSTVKKIIERHGGKIWAKSSLHSGAEFYFHVG